jgi:diaminohydroxyphosphoribosylaminopyrimidine deaminase/5-amino-6-(5-phosphoribosylamino)uracil reductase
MGGAWLQALVFSPAAVFLSPRAKNIEDPVTIATPDTVIWHDQMRRAFALAKKGPLVNENPRVGCVLVTDDGVIVAEGFHRGAGFDHAEVDALTQLKTKGISPAGLTAVVSLEPCRHEGRTPPCAKGLVEAGISRVVYSVSDPGMQSARGAQYLRDNGVEVIGGVLAEEGVDVVRHWHTATALGRPFVTVKWAQSLDGRIAASDGTSQWITSPESRSLVHQDRSDHGAIVVGTETALVDDPSLTARDDDGELYTSQPHAVVIGRRDIPASAKLHDHPAGFSHFPTRDVGEVLAQLYSRGIRSCYVEGGATLIAAFVKAGLVDEYHITMGPMLLGGNKVAITDIGVSTLDEARHLDIVDFFVTGGDIRIVARPAHHPPQLAKEA